MSTRRSSRPDSSAALVDIFFKVGGGEMHNLALLSHGLESEDGSQSSIFGAVKTTNRLKF